MDHTTVDAGATTSVAPASSSGTIRSGATNAGTSLAATTAATRPNHHRCCSYGHRTASAAAGAAGSVTWWKRATPQPPPGLRDALLCATYLEGTLQREMGQCKTGTLQKLTPFKYTLAWTDAARLQLAAVTYSLIGVLWC